MKETPVGKFIKDKQIAIRQDLEPVSEINWYKRAAEACENVSDAILHEKGISARIVRGIAGKLGFAGTTAGMFSVASLFGAASTGTAIGSLSGAAFTSASLAWIGGSVAIGSIVLGVAAAAGGLGAVLGAGWVSKKYLWGDKRQKTELEEQEQKVVDACLALAMAFRAQEKQGRSIDPISANAIYGDALKPLCEELLECKFRAQSWPIMARRKLSAAIDVLQGVTGYLYGWSKKNPNAAIGIVSVVLVKLLADDIPDFNENEQLVLDALRRSNNDLRHASDEELALYIQDMNPVQISGLTNNVKGIYHELLFQNNMNNSDNNYSVEIFEATNHPGADVRIINQLSGDVEEIQLKATNYLTYIEQHNAKYTDIEVFATDEVASQSEAITSTGISNKEISAEVSGVFSGLDDFDDPGPLLSMSVAAMITLARNTKVFLKEEDISQKEKEKLVKEGAVSAGVAGLLHLLM